MPDLLEKSADRDAADDFRERLQGELGKPADDGDQVHALILDIATTLGMTIRATKDVKGSGFDGLQVEEEK